MASIVTRLGDRMLRAFVPAATASATGTSPKCHCQCSDACFYCCPAGVTPEGLPIYSCHVASGSQCM
ncbi:hypothetical protein Afil01_02780 [Actinorhabdospora filicis]|uniref:Uncharacterized protein n=1 Tax=Actinorhabdospora filicis TaxID=1785913 RepID=A0A9W6W7G7_9ACTN|nr:hypothetical protein [Actinorhabdospora filicis]GLZ75471.1 hypothetical protein Afil01_02780 [Actinorhabdospora filicis]